MLNQLIDTVLAKDKEFVAWRAIADSVRWSRSHRSTVMVRACRVRRVRRHVLYRLTARDWAASATSRASATTGLPTS